MAREADGICESKADFAFTGNRGETAFDNEAITNYDTVDCNDDIDGDDDDGDDDIHIDKSVDNNGQIDESIIILDDDDSAGDNEINNDDSRCDEDENEGVDVDRDVDGSDDCDIDTENSGYDEGHDNVNNNSVDIGGNIDAYDDDDDDDKANFDHSDDGDNYTNDNGLVNHNDDVDDVHISVDVDDVHSDADASDDNNVEDAILDNSDGAINNRFSDEDGNGCDNRDDKDVDDIHIEDAVDVDGNIGGIIDDNGDASDNSVIDIGHGGIHDYNNAIDKVVYDDDDDGNLVDGIIDDDANVKDGGDNDGEDIYDDDNNGSNDSGNHVDDEDDGSDNRGDNHASYSGVHEPDCISNSLEIAEEMSTVVGYPMHLDISKNNEKVTEVKDQNHPVEDCKIMHNTDGHSINTHDLEASNELFNEEKTEVTDGTEINGEPLFVEPYSHCYGIENDHQDGGIGSFNDYISNSDDNVDGDDDEGLKYNDIEEEKGVETLANSADLIMDDNSDSAVISRPTSR